MEQVGWNQNKILYSLPKKVDDQKVMDFVQFLAKEQNLTSQEIWSVIGKDNIKSFYETYPAFSKAQFIFLFYDLCKIYIISLQKEFQEQNHPT